MEEIKVGEYVRTKTGIIRKRKTIEVSNSIIIADKEYYQPYYVTDVISKGEIVNHSLNIIDLIEEGDYVNGMLVTSVIKLDSNTNYIPTTIIFVNRDLKCTAPALKLYNKDIKSIVTKEQFKSIEYIIEEVGINH